jgi:hypothetical protein
MFSENYLDNEIIPKATKMEQCDVKNKCQNLFNKIENNCIKLVFAKNRDNKETITKCAEIEKELIQEALTCNEAVYVKMFFLSEYKEQIYNSMHDPYFERIENDVFNELNRIINSMYTYEDIYQYQHEQNHFLFKNKFYSFFEFVESKGVNIIDSWNNTEEYDDFQCHEDEFW